MSKRHTFTPEFKSEVVLQLLSVEKRPLVSLRELDIESNFLSIEFLWQP